MPEATPFARFNRYRNHGNLLTWYDVDPNFGTGLILGMGTTFAQEAPIISG
ncbi:MAG: hypothetical protein IPQ28_09615 [Sphingobacteriales bacterium]|nr:hypothetical protein [Sphingobacteriales bacterium]